ncbi:hypothetical protein LCGC14_0945790 [marine sediment metagenome]|uniref:Uncharacterized protein n=1 Tax=marine sediment metagenome TaxID=412755 RepID=A0A0F9R2B1_9ZZZZ
MSKVIIQESFQEKYGIKNILEKSWQDFINRDTYLISDEKSRFLSEINQLVKFPRIPFFKFKQRKVIKQFKRVLGDLSNEIKSYNELFIKDRLRNFYTSP